MIMIEDLTFSYEVENLKPRFNIKYIPILILHPSNGK